MNCIKRLLIKSIIKKCSRDPKPDKTFMVFSGVIGGACFMMLCGIYSTLQESNEIDKRFEKYGYPRNILNEKEYNKMENKN